MAQKARASLGLTVGGEPAQATGAVDELEPGDVAAEAAVDVVVLAVDVGRDRSPDGDVAGAPA